MRLLCIFVICLMTFNVLAKPLPIAHRGASGSSPENTLSSIRSAQSLGIKYIEIDIQMTKDQRIVALHDLTIDRTSNGKGRVTELIWSELRLLDFGGWFDGKFKGELIPSLEQVLNLLKPKDKLIIEFKYGSDKYPGIEKNVIDLVKKLNKSGQVILKSFSMNVLRKIKELAPGMQRLYCVFYGNDWLTIDDSLRFEGVFNRGSFQFLQVHKYFLTRSLIEKAHKKGIQVVVWDVHDKETMSKFSAMGVDFIESDYPEYILGI